MFANDVDELSLNIHEQSSVTCWLPGTRAYGDSKDILIGWQWWKWNYDKFQEKLLNLWITPQKPPWLNWASIVPESTHMEDTGIYTVAQTLDGSIGKGRP